MHSEVERHAEHSRMRHRNQQRAYDGGEVKSVVARIVPHIAPPEDVRAVF